MRSSESNTLYKNKNFQYCQFSKWFPHEWIASNWLQLPLGWPRHDWKKSHQIVPNCFPKFSAKFGSKSLSAQWKKTYSRKHIFDSYQNSDVWQSNFDFRFAWLPKSRKSIRFFPKFSVNFKFGSPKKISGFQWRDIL